MPQKPQTMPLALSGVPQPAQIPVAAPAPAAPPSPPAQPQSVQIQQQPFNPVQAQAEATARDQSLAAQAQQIYPDQTKASILATLSGIAGNIAGALTGKGDVGAQAVQYGGDLREQQAQKQRQFMARVVDAEQRYKQEQKDLTDLQNRQLRANSMVPLINRLPDAEVKAALFTQLAAGDVDGADAGLRHAMEMQRQRERDALDRKLKIERSDMAATRLEMAQQKQEIDNYLKSLRAEDLATKPVREQQKIIDKQTKDYNANIKKIAAPITDYVSIMQQLGDPNSPEAKERLNRISGLFGTARGAYGLKASPEDRKLYQSLQHLIATVKTEDFGGSLTSNEQAILKAAFGTNIGGGLLGGIGKDADSVIAGLQGLEQVFNSRLSAAGANMHEKTLAGFEKNGSPLTQRSFNQAIQDARAIGGKNLDAVPQGVAPDVWAKLPRAQRVEFYKQVMGAGNAQ